ncbi:MAG TPA: VWA domain-containing protein [Planctomycetaceae bacterium]|nr:VWA domain-containing protein [Planctomycetaceae bacterium]
MWRLRRILVSVFPPPRRPVTFRQAVPLVVFLVTYATVCLALEWTGRALFVRPAMFALIAVAPWFWWLHVSGFSGLSRGRALAALLLRLSLVGLFVMVLAEPRAVRTEDKLSVVYLVDLSDSIDDRSVDQALGFVTKVVYEKPANDEAGLIVFGRSAAVELPPRPTFPLDEGISLNSRIQRDATNLEQALSLAAAMLPEDAPSRIVLISDGTQTEGSVSRILDELKARQIPVDVLPIEYDYDEEVWIERVDLPRFVKIGENYEASIVLASLKDGEGELVLAENGQPIYREQITYPGGKSRYDIPIKLRGPGYYEYAATIVPASPSGDNQPRNNRASNYIYVAGEGKVLLVVDPQGDRRDWDRLERALLEGERQVELMTAFDFPRDALSLLPYDAIVFVNVPADAFDAVQFRAAHDAVKDLGVGFLMVGGPNSFGPGGYHRTAIEETLPVTMDVSKKKILPKGALAIILHTCEFAEGNTWAKRITREAIRVMSGQDEVGVLLYDSGGERWLFPLTPASEYESLITKINAAEPGDMPFFGPTMQLGLTGLLASDASLKHMVIISDGDPQPPAPPLLQQYIDAKITVSTIAIQPHGNDTQTMQHVAGITGGRFYFPQDPSRLPGIFIKEAKTLQRNMVRNETVSPQLGVPSQILDGIRGVPDVHGYVLTTPRPRAETVLRVPVEEDDQVDPILCVWQFGLGRAGAFTSDLSTNWGADWVEWEKFRAFVKQLTTYIARVKQDTQLRLWSYTSGTEGVIIAEDFAPEDSFLSVVARVTGPDDRTEQVVLKQIGPRRYQAVVPLWGKGNYQVLAVGEGAGAEGKRTERAQDGFIVPYSPEYLRFRANPIALREIAGKTGGSELTKDSTTQDIYAARREPKQSSRPVFDWFLIALACLVPLDVAVRRIQIDFRAIRDWLLFKNRRGPSTETMSALLRRKREVETGFDARREAAPATGRPTPGESRRAVAAKALRPPTQHTATEPPPARDEQDATTTSRLLEMKRRRQQDQE